MSVVAVKCFAIPFYYHASVEFRSSKTYALLKFSEIYWCLKAGHDRFPTVHLSQIILLFQLSIFCIG